MKEPRLTPAALSALAKGDLENAMVASTPGGIERQEAMGQAAFVATKSALPIDCPRQQLEALGFRFGESIDDLFISVAFPPGWLKKATDHSMWIKLLDDKGRERGSIFYKAAFYDRKAHMPALENRYRVHHQYSEENEGPIVISVQDHDGKVLFEGAAVASRDWNGQHAERKRCEDWLTEHYPDWQKPEAYWQ